MQLCEYGCGQEAKFQFKNGKWCCSKNYLSCPHQRKKCKEEKTNLRLQKICYCKFCNKEFLLGNLKQHEKACKQNPDNIKIFVNDKICEYCGKIHDGSYGSGRFCCEKCSRAFSTKNLKNKTKILRCIECGEDSIVSIHILNENFRCLKCRRIDEDISFLLKRKNKCTIFFNICVFCNKLFTTKNNIKKCCSEECSINNRKKNGSFKGWQSRNIISYPEEFFIQVLKNNGIWEKCQFNYPIKKKILGIDEPYNYFLDFYFEDLKIDLEIDGRQHEDIERVESDRKRDIALTNNGIYVYRIKWKNPINDENKAYIKEEINKFLDFYSKYKIEIAI